MLLSEKMSALKIKTKVWTTSGKRLTSGRHRPWIHLARWVLEFRLPRACRLRRRWGWPGWWQSHWWASSPGGRLANTPGCKPPPNHPGNPNLFILVWFAHSGGEEGAGLELLQPHGAGVGAKEQDEGHEGDVWDEVAGLAHQLAFVLQALGPCERRPRGVHWLQGESKKKKRHNRKDTALLRL